MECRCSSHAMLGLLVTVMNMTKLLITIITAITTCSPVIAGNSVDKGIATTIIYAVHCDKNSVPPVVERGINQHLLTRTAEVEEEIKDFMSQFDTFGSNKVTALQAWCKLMKPKHEALMREMEVRR